MDQDSPLACLLVGQPTLRRTMKLAVLAALEQRTALRYTMPGMTAAETSSYVTHHLKLAGRADQLFTRVIWGNEDQRRCSRRSRCHVRVREGKRQKRQRRQPVASLALQSAVCVADGPQITRPRQKEERTKRGRRLPSRTPDHDPGLPRTR
jgi:hypothetical protein